jgi:hypothetical protein
VAIGRNNLSLDDEEKTIDVDSPAGGLTVQEEGKRSEALREISTSQGYNS